MVVPTGNVEGRGLSRMGLKQLKQQSLVYNLHSLTTRVESQF